MAFEGLCGDGTPECVKWSSVVVQLDNTGTSFAEETTIEIENSDGSVDVIVTGPHAGWSDQILDIAAQMDAIYSGTYDGRCVNGCGGLLTPPSDAPAQPGIAARYVNGVHCPTDLVIPVKATGSSDTRKPRVLPLFVIETPEKRGTICRSCDGIEGELLDENGEPVPEADLPVCLFDCAEQIPETPVGACQFDVLDGNWCDIVSSGDPETEDEVIQSEILVTVATCGSEQSISFSVVDGDAVVDYEPVGAIVDCETGEAPFVEAPDCPPGSVFEYVEIPGSNYGILDNSLWDNAPANHLQNGKDYEITLTRADGSTIVLPALSDPYFNGFRTVFEAALPDCKVLPVCANHTSPKGCNAAHVANLAMYPAYDAPLAPGDVQNNLNNPATAELWATGWLLDCAGCESPIVSAEITGSNDAAWIGASKQINVYQNETVSAFRAVTCDGVFWKDCDGNDIEAPVGGCCAKPAGSGGDALEQIACTVTECTGECATRFLTPFPGRPDNSVAHWITLADGTEIRGETYAEFSAAMAEAGFTEGIDGEQHWFCPCPEGAEYSVQVNPRQVETTPLTCEPNPNAEPGECALRTTGCNDDRRDAKLDTIIGLLEQLVGCMCGPCGVELDQRCSSYSNPLTSGYNNWGDPDEVEDLADEFGVSPTVNEMWVRIVEFDCGGTAQPQVGQIFGPYTPGPNGPDDFIDDLEAAVTGSCLVPSVNGNGGPGFGGTSIGHGIDYSFDSTQDSTLVIQEGVTVGAGVGWFTSAQGFVARGGVVGDFISSSGNAATTNYAAAGIDDLDQFAPAEGCESL